MREEWEKQVRTPPTHPPLSKEERDELRQLLQTKIMKRVSGLVYAKIAQECLAMLTRQDASAPLIAAHNRSPDVVFGHMWEMCNERD
jgi:hypothetical protein